VKNEGGDADAAMEAQEVTLIDPPGLDEAVGQGKPPEDDGRLVVDCVTAAPSERVIPGDVE